MMFGVLMNGIGWARRRYAGSWSDGGDVRCLRSLGALADGVGDLLSLVEGAVAGAGDRREVDEHVGAAAVRGDEPESLLRVEPFDGALSHGVLQMSTDHRGRAPAVTRVSGAGDGPAAARCRSRPCPPTAPPSTPSP